MSINRRLIITILSLIALGLAIELCIVYYNANFAVNSQPSICAINDMIDCDDVAKTSYSQFFGVPLSIWGVLLYIIFLLLNYADRLAEKKYLHIFKIFKNPLSYIFCIGLFSFIISISLGLVSVFKINSICIFCFMTYFINLLIAIAAKEKDISIIENIKYTINDFIEALKNKQNLIIFLLVSLAIISILTYTTTSNILSPQISKQAELKKYTKSYNTLVNKNEIGPKDANVIVHEYIDFNCGGCFFAHLYMHRVIEEFENVKVIQHNLPLEKICNHNMKFDGHKNSCLKSRYALAAAKQNKYWQMADILFEQSPDSEKEIIQEARLLDFDIKKLKEDANSKEIDNEIKQSIEEADKKGVEGTPTIYIGIKNIMGVNSYPEFRQFIISQGGRVKGE